MQHTTLQSNEFKIKNPTGIVQILCFIIMLVMMLLRNLISDTRHDNSDSILTYVSYGWILVISIVLVINIYRSFMKPSVLRINPESLFINGRIIEANQIKMVMVRGYFKPILGIKPKRNKVVPLHLCFRFLDDKDKGMKELSKWAEDNQIPFIHKRFTRWI